jgi:hypothetical protein
VSTPFAFSLSRLARTLAQNLLLLKAFTFLGRMIRSLQSTRATGNGTGDGACGDIAACYGGWRVNAASPTRAGNAVIAAGY